MTKIYIKEPLLLVRFHKFKDISGGRMLFTVTEFCTQELEFERHSPYSQHRPAAKIMKRIRGFASWFSAACGAPGSAGSLEEVTGWVPRGAENSKIGRRQGASIALALQDTPLTLSTGAPSLVQKSETMFPPCTVAGSCGSSQVCSVAL
ncbi:hypothetical protein INR49_025244 [Caranx melampygus]|nr:hypothetical protein INR49_025244 [Caranx melampygus]